MTTPVLGSAGGVPADTPSADGLAVVDGELLVGHRAPEIELPDQHGSPFSLVESRAAGPVLVVFFPFAFSGTCTGEMAGLVELYGQLADAGTTLVAVSCDQLFALRVFSDQVGMQFPVLSDFWPHGRLARAYGVFDPERGCAVRGSFLVDRAGILRWSVVNSIGAGRDLPSHVAAAAALVPDLTA